MSPFYITPPPPSTSSPVTRARFRGRLLGPVRERRRESNNKRRVNAMMRRNLFISKLWPLSFVGGRNTRRWLVETFPRQGRSAFQKLLSATSRRYFVKSRRIDKRHEGCVRGRPSAISCPFFDAMFRDMTYDVPGYLYITAQRTYSPRNSGQSYPGEGWRKRKRFSSSFATHLYF